MRKKRLFLETFPRPARLRQPPQKRRGDPRKRAGFLDSERGGFCRPSLCLFALLVKLLSRLSVRVSCGLLGGFTGRCGLDVLRPPVDPRLPHVAVRVGRPLLAVTGPGALQRPPTRTARALSTSFAMLRSVEYRSIGAALAALPSGGEASAVWCCVQFVTPETN